MGNVVVINKNFQVLDAVYLPSSTLVPAESTWVAKTTSGLVVLVVVVEPFGQGNLYPQGTLSSWLMNN